MRQPRRLANNRNKLTGQRLAADSIFSNRTSPFANGTRLPWANSAQLFVEHAHRSGHRAHPCLGVETAGLAKDHGVTRPKVAPRAPP